LKQTKIRKCDPPLAADRNNNANQGLRLQEFLKIAALPASNGRRARLPARHGVAGRERHKDSQRKAIQAWCNLVAMFFQPMIRINNFGY